MLPRSSLCPSIGQQTFSIFLLTVACFLSCCYAWPGVGVLAIYYETNWNPPVWAQYTRTIDGSTGNVTNRPFFGPMFTHGNFKYFEVPANGALIDFVNSRNETDDNGGNYYDFSFPGIFKLTRGGHMQVVQKYYTGCPGAPPTNPVDFCSSHGSCDLYNEECVCDDSWTEPACEGYTLCPRFEKNVLEGTIFQNYRNIYTASECCTKCYEMSSLCAGAVYDYVHFSCEVYNVTTGMRHVKNADKVSLAFPVEPSSTPEPTGNSTTTAEPQPTGNVTSTAAPPGTSGAPHPGTTPKPRRTDHDLSDKVIYIITASAGFVLLVIGMILIYVCLQRKKRPTALSARALSNASLSAKGDPLLDGNVGGGGTFSRQDSMNRPRARGSNSPPSAYEAKYKIVRRLGGGAFGIVYLVAPRVPRKPSHEVLLQSGCPSSPSDHFAMKVIYCYSDDEIMRAFNEFRSFRQLQGHSGVAKLVDMFMSWETFDDNRSSRRLSPRDQSGMEVSPGSLQIGRDEDFDGEESMNTLADAGNTRYLCLVMEYYKEGNLEDGVASDPLYFGNPKTVVSFLEQIVNALAHCHEQNIIHRDLKPANVLLADGRTRAVLTDFGLARDLKNSSTSIAGGTLHYLAPEQLDHRCSKQSDVWSAACIIVAMITGRVGGSVRAMFMWRIQPTFEEELRTELEAFEQPPEVIDLLVNMLAYSPVERPSMQQCSEAIKAMSSTQ